jgi:hypothetical protein
MNVEEVEARLAEYDRLRAALIDAYQRTTIARQPAECEWLCACCNGTGRRIFGRL